MLHVHAESPQEALDAVANGMDFVDASFAVSATSAGCAVLLQPEQWAAHDAESCNAPPQQSTSPFAALQPAMAEQSSSQHSHRLHGKQRNPRNKPPVTMKAAAALEEAAPAGEGSGMQQSLQVPDKQASKPMHPSNAGRGDQSRAGMAVTEELPASHLEPASATPQNASLGRGAPQTSMQGREPGLHQHASTGKGKDMQYKRGLAAQAPSHVKHPRHRQDSYQEAASDLSAVQAGLQPDSATAKDSTPGGADSGRARQLHNQEPEASDAAASEGTPEPLGGQYGLPSSIVLNMWDARHRANSRPLSAHCACSTCQRHSRAYVHHLLRTKEILAQVQSHAASPHDLHIAKQALWQCVRALQSDSVGHSVGAPTWYHRRAMSLRRCCWKSTTRTVSAGSSQVHVRPSCVAS